MNGDKILFSQQHNRPPKYGIRSELDRYQQRLPAHVGDFQNGGRSSCSGTSASVDCGATIRRPSVRFGGSEFTVHQRYRTMLPSGQGVCGKRQYRNEIRREGHYGVGYDTRNLFGCFYMGLQSRINQQRFVEKCGSLQPDKYRFGDRLSGGPDCRRGGIF